MKKEQGVRKIWKYSVDLDDLQEEGMVEFMMPMLCEIVHVGPEPSNPENYKKICLWGVVQESRGQKRTFAIVGTGHPIPERAIEYIGSVVIKPFAWHVFEVV